MACEPWLAEVSKQLFDAGYYFRTYPEVAATGTDPYQHYIHYGAARGYDPQALFDTSYYLELYPDVAASGMNPLRHYAEYGAAEGRNPHPLFDTSYYAGHAQLATGGENPILHYCNRGFKRGLSPHPLFDAGLFFEQCPEAAARGDNPFLEFLARRGAATPRPHILFSTEYYLRENPDVAAHPVNPFLHYLLYGWRENRNPHVLFDNRFYRAQYDSAPEGICPLHHYVTKGSRLGLRPHLLFDGKFYVAEHPEVAESGESALAHYLRVGYRLNFNPSACFDGTEYLEKHAGSVPSGVSPIEHLSEHGDYADIAPLMRGNLLDPPLCERVAEVSADTPASPRQLPMKLIAFYLPQYHEIPENNLWWGQGFTDWRNVARATPSFHGHYQPRIPADLGHYDLSHPEVLERQAELAGEYGIHGFCFYHYWFDGHHLLERPLQQMIARRSPSFPFCICWANERWSRRWDASPHEILIEQLYSKDFAERFIRDCLPILTDANYIRVAGAPLLLVYHPTEIPEINGVADCWRRIFFRETGLELHLTMLDTRQSTIVPRSVGFDSMVEFAPRLRNSILNPEHIAGLRSDFTGQFDDYRELVRRALLRGPTDCAYYRCVMPGWDNTARFGARARIVVNGTPDAYQAWLRSAVALGWPKEASRRPWCLSSPGTSGPKVLILNRTRGTVTASCRPPGMHFVRACRTTTISTEAMSRLTLQPMVVR